MTTKTATTTLDPRAARRARSLARVGLGVLAAVALLAAGAAQAQTISTGPASTGEPAANTTVAPGSPKVLLDAFTMTASTGTAPVTSVTVVLTTGAAALVERITIEDSQYCAMPTPYGTALNPASDTVVVSTSGLSVATGAARPYWVCLKPKSAAAMAAVPGSSLAVTGRVSAATATGYTAGTNTDTVAAGARVIDNASPAAVTAVSGVAGDHQVGLRWTNPADTDFKEVVILQNTAAITDVPVEGVAYEPFTFNDVSGTYQPTLIGTSRVAYVGNATTQAIGGGTDPATWLTNGTAYYFKIFARDASGNYSAAGVQVGPFTPTASSATTIGAGSESAASTRAPGGAIADLDAFTLITSTGTDTVTALTVSLSPAKAFTVIQTVTITSNDGLTTYGTATPTSNTVSFSGLSIPVTTGLTQYRVRITPKSHAAMPAVPGASYGVTGLVTSFTCTKAKAGADSGSSTVTIDNLSPNDVVLGAVTPGNAQVALNWTNPTGDFSRVLVLRSGAPVTAYPVEGDVAATPALVGTATQVFQGAATTTTNTGLTNGQPYYYKIFTQDTSGNWSAGVGVGPLIPGAGGAASGSTVPNTLLPVVQVLNPSPGAKLATTFKVQVRAWSPAADITAVTVRVNGASPTALTKNAKYGGGTTSGVWETVGPAHLTLAAGTYTLDAQATSSVGTVTSNSLQVTVSATKGDGNLLVRDNATQLCADCHALPTHSSEVTGSTYGSWSTACRDCHVPHGTKNVFLVGETITPPPRGAGTTAAKTVAFSNTTGVVGNMTARTSATYVNSDNTGPCQVCHTLTNYYRADGTSPGGAGHQTGQRCTNCHQHQTGMAVNCTGCHGDPARTVGVGVTGTDARLQAAPPRDTTGATVVTSRGVGAHQAHVNQNTFRTNALSCADCHPAANAHQGTVDLAWSPLANGTTASVALTPNFNGTTCASTWCHSAGGTYGGTILSPSWTGGPSQVSCSSCHGAPPPAPHPANPACESCHAGYSTSTGINATAKLTHIDGTIQVPGGGGCTACHGTAGRTPVAGLAGTDPNIAVAPPMSTSGATTADAHLAHVNKRSVPVLCTDCHGTLPVVGDPSHPSGTVDVSMLGSALANQNGGFAAYTVADKSCSTVYCHGATLPSTAKGTNTLPKWTDTVTCGSCHGSPPGDAIHKSVAGLTACIKCHDQTVDSSGGIVINAGLHVNGVVETNVMDFGCASCHGDATRTNNGFAPATFFEGAPPTTIPGSPGAGVHLAHVYGTRSKNVECEECHQGSTAFEAFSPNPQSMWLHADGVVDLAFGPLAAQGGAVPAYAVGTGGSCAATYCHGNFSGGAGASNVTPTWLTSGQLACTACHGNPPALPHPQNDGCTSCHGANYTKTGNTTGTVNQVSHVDGTTTGQTFGCTSCHGVVNTAAPGATSASPVLAAPGVSGGLAPTTSAAPSVSVPQYGLHAAHLTQNNFTAEPIACGSCHLVPADGNTAHGSGTGGTGGATATVTFSDLAYGNVAAKVTPVTTASLKGGATAGATAAAAAPGTGGASTSAWSTPATPIYARASGCATVYCHGEFKNGQTGKTTISWTTDVTLNCNSCHGTVGAPMPATPPPTGHPASTTCGSCHNGYTGTSVNLAVHLNGKLEVSGGTACSDCHGDAARTAMVSGTFGPAQLANNLLGMPPKATTGATTGFLVGAHQSHSVPTTPNQQVFRPVQCSECHGIAVNTYPLGHSDGTAQLTFASSAIAGASNVAASITKNTPASPDTCVTYCHGGSLTAAQKGAITVWQWNSTASATCGSCHGAAPADPVHTSVSKSAPATACNPCHNTVVNSSGNIIFTGTGTGATTLHINGSRQATTTCTSCHGGTNNAPPRATSGATATTVAKVGAHQKHVTGTTLRSAALGCVECHASVPAAQNHASGTVEMGYSTLAKTFSVTPAPADLGGTAQTTWEASPSCTNYCHGAKWAADANYRGNTTSPLWTGTTADADCGDCHRSPPATSGHATVTSTTSCGTCHTGYTCTPATLATCTVNKTAHMNGQLDANLTCASCHGLNSRTAMVSGTFGPAQSANNLLAVPPNDTKGASTGVLVGGHLSHAVPQTPNQQVFKSILCSECHGIAVNSYTTSHPNGTSNVTFASATTANLANVAAAVTQNTPPTADTCVTYCHGGSLTAAQKGSVTVWQWNTSVNATCGSCHGAAPNDPVHTSVSKSAPATACNPCHNTVVNTSGNIIFTGTGTGATTLHINGSRQNTAACNSCHGGAVNAAPPLATAGATTITNAKVGAHQRHVTATNLRSAALGCGDCHNVPVSMAHATGTVDMTYGTLATASAVSATPGSMSGAAQTTWEATPTCTNYCHGGKWSGNATYQGGLTTPNWTTTGVATQCNDCHKAPPNNGNHASVLGSTTKNCGDCHAGYSCTTGNLAACTVNKTVHLNGTFDGATLSCTSCHGSGSNAAPPLATTGATATTVAKVGAHQKHLTGSSLRTTALACNNCHTVPGSTTHSNGTVDLTWNTLPSASAVSPSPTSLTGAALTAWEATPTCTNYCHGGKWAANANYRGNFYQPRWTDGVADVTCSGCHQAPPNSASHASVTSTKNCGDCHTGYNCTSGNLAACSVNKTIHLNGTFETPSMACSACHGLASRTSMVSGTFGPAQSANNLLAVPPNDSKGASTGVLVGGHLSHAVPQTPNQQVFKSILCSECHGIAVNTYTSAHPNSVADVTFASATTAGLGNVAAAITKNVAPTADTCVTYCHGGSLTAAQKGAITVWQWNTSVSATCGSCHGSPPADAVHTSVTKPSAATACNPCHNTVVNSSGNIMFTGTGTAATTLHINGSRQATTSCTSCHGGTNNAPPKATAGASTTTNPKVGAHQTHVTATRLRSVALGCVECHASVPAVQNHASGTVEMGYSTLAATASVTPSPGNMSGTALTTWEATPTCTNYCHGGKWAANASYRGNTTSPSWIGTSADADCGDCHRSPPATSGHSTVTSTTDCGSCHTGYTCTPATLATCTVNKTVHMNGSLQVNASCVGCHAGSVTGTGAGFSITRRPIVREFGYAWSHKRSASPAGTVSAADCGVCHMEGDVSGNMNGTYHANGLINLRDPDTGQHIKQVAFVTVGNSVTSGNTVGWGYYDTSSTTDATFYTFARNLSSNALEATVQAIMVNQCLKCHDSNGAASASARIGTVAAKPFNTTIGSTSNYTGTGVTAAGTPGGVTDVNASFATSNAAYHPIRGRQNNSYVSSARMYAPWNTVTKTAGNTTSWGYIISCWDCHAPQGAIGLQTMTVTAHGGTTTLRRAYWNANATNLCTACHNVSIGSSTHGTGSAWATTGNSTPGGIAKTSCYRCHGSSNADARPTRPYSAQDVHGVNGFAPYAGTTDTLWPVGTTNTWRPYAFFRSAGGSGLWNGGSASWKPLSGPSVPTGGATCSAQANGANVTADTALGTSCSAKIHGTYTPGGVY